MEEVNVKENGHQTPPDTGQSEHKTIVSVNPVNGKVIGEIETATPGEAHLAMERARRAQKTWGALSLDERLRKIKKVRDVFYNLHENIIQIMVEEQGKVAHEALIELLPTIALMDYYLRNAKKILKPHSEFVALIPYRKHVSVRRPHGVVLVITPWNYPFLLSVGPVIAALITGNTVILKPSEHASQTGVLIERIFRDGGIPDDVFQVVQGYGDVGAALVDAKPNKISFTGSEAVGRKIAARAGELLIPVTLELGGKDAAIVLEDANIKRTAHGIVWGGLINAGQACLAVERIFVMRSVADELVETMREVIEKHVRPGAGDQPDTSFGSITTEAQLKIIERQVQDAMNKGATIVTGGQLIDMPGRFYAPTIVTNITEDMEIYTEETFGPVISVIPVDSEREAIELTNASVYGLGASIWTEDQKRGRNIARQLNVGMISINDHLSSPNAPQMPWGGVGASGYGRTRSHEGLTDMTISHAISSERFRLPLFLEPFWLPYTPLKRTLARRFTRFWFGPTLKERLKAFSLREW
jgi:acyl-CoA reductase-like NAD-dependent aldehyde dehydrogenase